MARTGVFAQKTFADKVADNLTGWETVSNSPDFCLDWQTDSWVAAARAKLGSPALDQCYGFKIWPALNHDYSAENMVIQKLAEWLSASGDIGNRIKDLPDGTQVRLIIKHAKQEPS